MKVSEIWASREQMEAFGEGLMPILVDIGIESPASPRCSRLTTSSSPSERRFASSAACCSASTSGGCARDSSRTCLDLRVLSVSRVRGGLDRAKPVDPPPMVPLPAGPAAASTRSARRALC